MGLNPHAVEFAPQRCIAREPWQKAYTGWGLCGTLPRQSQPEHSCANASQGPSMPFTELPNELLQDVLERLRNPADLLAVSLTCKTLKSVVAVSQVSAEGRFLQHHKQIEFLESLTGIYKGLEVLDLSECDQLEIQPICKALERLPGLKHLDLAGCRKVDDSALQNLSSVLHGYNKTKGERRVCRLETISLQKCYRLGSSALSIMLQTASHPQSSLNTLIFSLLNLQDWPSHDMGVTGGRTLGCQMCPAACRVSTSGLKVLALINTQHLAPDNLAYLAACCPELEVLLLGGSTFDVPLVLETLEEGSESEEPNQRQGVDSGLGAFMSPMSPRHKSRGERLASTLKDALFTLSALKVLELTFFPTQAVRILATDLEGIEVWDFTQIDSLRKACAMLQRRRQEMGSLYKHVEKAISAAVNCTSYSKQTPLHIAVQADKLEAMKIAVRLGANMEIKDKRGATPLFFACEAGRSRPVDFLAQSGAILSTGNSSAEAPLYIAALRGNAEIVQTLLSAFEERQISWVYQRYGDGWNPLMATAVTTHPTANAIAYSLLQAAGSKAGALTLSANKYGQTVAHLAARKGNHVLLGHLLQAAGNGLAVVKDNAGVTPLMIAQTHRNEEARLLLLSAKKFFQESQKTIRKKRTPRSFDSPIPRAYHMLAILDQPVTVQY